MSRTNTKVITALAAALGLSAGVAWAQSPRDDAAPRARAPSTPGKAPTAGAPGTPSATPRTPPANPNALSGTRAGKAGKALDRTEVDRIVGGWPAPSRAAAYLTIKTYGLPSDGGPSALVWHDNGVWKRTTVFRDPIAHQFPRPHFDVLEQVVDHRIPADKVDDLAAFDGSVIAFRTGGELAARCDREAMNLLAINLAHDVLMGDKDADEAREQLVRDATAFMVGGEAPATTTKLAFQPGRAPAGDPGQVAIPGAPQLASTATAGQTRGAIGDPAVLAAMIAINAHELDMARVVLEHGKEERVRAYARMLQQEHGEGLKTAMALGPEVDVTPIVRGPVVTLQRDAAESIAKLAMAEPEEFDDAVVVRAIADHEKALQLIDRTLLRSVENAQIRSSLTELRAMVARHLDQAKKLKGGAGASR